MAPKRPAQAANKENVSGAASGPSPSATKALPRQSPDVNETNVKPTTAATSLPTTNTATPTATMSHNSTTAAVTTPPSPATTAPPTSITTTPTTATAAPPSSTTTAKAAPPSSTATPTAAPVAAPTSTTTPAAAPVAPPATATAAPPTSTTTTATTATAAPPSSTATPTAAPVAAPTSSTTPATATAAPPTSLTTPTTATAAPPTSTITTTAAAVAPPSSTTAVTTPLTPLTSTTTNKTTTTTSGGVGPITSTHGCGENPLAAIRSIAVEHWQPAGHENALGARILDRQTGLASFRLWGPHIDKAHLVLEHCGDERQIEMVAESDSTFACQVAPIKEGTAYHFVFTSRWNNCFESEGNELHRRDPYAKQVDFDSNTCYVVDPTAFKWDQFKAPSKNELIVYELHVGTFARTDGKSQFAAVTEKLRYIKDLGYNTIELMPVQEFGGKWGYNPRLLMAPHGKYGTPHELRVLVNEAHRIGLAVIFDLVLNHGSVNLNSLWNYDGYGPNGNGGIYYEGSSDSGWGRTFAFGKREVRDMIKEGALTFAVEYNADGLRLDAVHHMPWNFLKELTHYLREKSANCFLVAEITPENPEVCHGAGFDSCWVHASYYDVVKIMRQKDSEHHISMMRAIINGHRGFRRAYQSTNSVLGSHDQCGNRHPQGDRSGDDRVGGYFIDQLGGRQNWHGRAQCRMWFALQALSRPLPMTFMGSESLQGGWWHIDRYFDWSLVETDQDTIQMLKLVRQVHKIRQSNACFSEDASLEFCHEDSHNRVLGFSRAAHLLVVVNAGEEQWEGRDYGVRSPWPEGEAVDQLFNSQAGEFGGWEESWTAEPITSGESAGVGRKQLAVGSNSCLHVNLPKWSVSVYRRSAK